MARPKRGLRGGPKLWVAFLLCGAFIAGIVPPVAGQGPGASPSPAPSAAPSHSASSSTEPGQPQPTVLGVPLAGPGVLPTDQASVDLVGRIRSKTFGADSVTAAEEALALAGIAVLAPDSDEPLVPISGAPSPLRFQDWQLHAMALEAWAGNGASGLDLDTASPVPDDSPLSSSFLAGWVAAADTAAARLARAVLAGQDVTDPTALVVPMLVVALFSADIAADVPAAANCSGVAETAIDGGISTAGSRGGRAMSQGLAAGGICSDATGFIDNAISAVFSALHATAPERGVGQVVVSVWNWLVDRGQDFVRSLVKELTAPVISVIRLVAGTLATVAHAVAAIVPYTVVVIGAPFEVTLPPDPGPPVTGNFYVSVTAGDLPDWPGVLSDCAQEAGVKLPSFKPAGNPIVWGPMRNADGALIRDTADSALDESGTGKLAFHSITEPTEVASGDSHTIQVHVEAKIERRDVQEQVASLQGLLVGQIPGIVRPFVAEALQPFIDGLSSRLTGLLDARGDGFLYLTSHTPRQTPTPQPTPTQPGSVWIHFDRPTMPGKMAGRIWDLVACEGPSGAWTGTFLAGGIQANGKVIVPFQRVAVHFTPKNGKATVHIGATLSYGVLTIKARWQLTITMDGSKVTISGRGSSTGPGGSVASEWLDIAPLSLPIEAPPPGRC